MVTQCAIQRAGHVSDDLHRRVIDAVLFPRLGIERLKEILVEIEDRVAPIGLDCKDFRREAVDSIAHHFEADANFAGDLGLAQDTKRRSHQRMLLGHMLPGVDADFLLLLRHAGPIGQRLAYQQQSKGQRLGKGRGEEDIEVGFRISASFRVSVEDVAERFTDQQQRVLIDIRCPKFRQPLLHDAAHEPCRMREELRQMLCVARRRRIGAAQSRKQIQKRPAIVRLDQLVGAGIADFRV